MTPDALASEGSLDDTMRQHAGFVRALARRLVVDPSFADDVEQETWMAALKARPAAGQNFRAWLSRVVRNFAARAVRDTKRRKRREESVARPPSIDPAQVLGRERILREVIDAVLDLPEPYRSTVLARYYENLAPAEIALRDGVPAATVRTRLKRGLDMVRAWFDQRHEGKREHWSSSLAVAIFGQIPLHALPLAGATAYGTGSVLLPGATLGGVLVVKKLAVLAVLGLAAGATYFALRNDDEASKPKAPTPTITQRGEDPLPEIVNTTPLGKTVPGPIVTRPFEDASPTPVAHEASSRAMARVVGRVIDEQGRPLAGVPVRSVVTEQRSGEGRFEMRREEDATQNNERTTDAQGRFVVNDVPLGRQVSLRAIPPTLCDVDRSVLVKQAGETDAGDLVARVGGGLSGRVTDTKSGPIKGARVQAYPLPKPGAAGPDVVVLSGPDVRRGREGVTGSDGRYRLEGLTSGDWLLTVAHPEAPPSHHRRVPIGRAEMSWNIDFELPLSERIEGVVKDESGAPLSGARVSLNAEQGPPEVLGLKAFLTETGVDGRFRLEGLPGVSYGLQVAHKGHASRHLSEVKAGQPSIGIELIKNALVIGVVTSGADRSPVETFDVHLNSGLFLRSTKMEVQRGEKAAALAASEPRAGLFVATDVPEEPFSLRVTAPGLAEKTLGPFTVKAGESLRVDVHLEPELIVRGAVLTSFGEKLAGAVIWVRDEPGEASGSLVGRRIERRSGGPAGGDIRLAGASERKVTSGADGSFEVPGLAVGTYRLTATHEDHAPSEPEAVVLESGGSSRQVLLRLRRGGRVLGVARDVNGRPLSDARIRVERLDKPGMSQALTDSEGRFVVNGMEPGKYGLSLEEESRIGAGASMEIRREGDEDARPGTVKVDVTEGSITKVELKRVAKARLTGVVTEAGRPVPGVKVALAGADPDMPFGAGSVTTAEDGTFALDEVHPGKCTLCLAVPGGSDTVRRLLELPSGGHHHEVVTLATGIIEGRVIDSHGKGVKGLALSLARSADDTTSGIPTRSRGIAIAVTQENGLPATTEIRVLGPQGPEPVLTDEDGRYVLRYLDADKYTVAIRGNGFIPQKKTQVEVREGRRTSNIDFEAQKGATLTVAFETSGEAPRLVIGRLQRADASPDAPALASEISQNGRDLVFRGLKPDKYTVKLEAPLEHLTGEAEVDVRRDLKHSIKLRP